MVLTLLWPCLMAAYICISGFGAGIEDVVDEVRPQRSGFYSVAPSQLSGVAWRMMLVFEALCALSVPEA